MVLRHDASLLQVDVGEHDPLAGDQAPGEEVGQAFLGELVPAEPGGGDVRREGGWGGHGDLRSEWAYSSAPESIRQADAHETRPIAEGAVTVAVAIQGEAGSFSHAAALAALGPDARLVPCPSFEELFSAVEAGAAERGVVPIEN